ncbi:MAG: SGNH/GDSL hydrolase family protein [Nitrospinaceae bacterium]
MTRLPKKTPTKYFFFSLIVTILFFALLEGFLRLIGYQPKLRFHAFELPSWFTGLDPVVLESYKEHLLSQGFVNEDVYAYRPDPELGYLLKPNIRLTVRNYSSALLVDKMPPWTLVSGPEGFRMSGKTSPDPPAGGKSYRTLHVLGDSSSFGWGVEYRETYGYVLRETLNRALPKDSRFFRLENHSMPGFTSFQGRRLLGRLHNVGPGDWVLVSFGWNDSYPSRDSDRVRFEKSHSPMGRLHWRLSHFLVFRAMESFWIGLGDGGNAGSSPAGTRVDLKEYRENLDAIFAAVKERGARPVFISVCNFYEFPKAARSAARASGTPFIDIPRQLKPYLSTVADRFPEKFVAYFDSYGDLMEKNESLVFLFPDNCHPNAIGHHLMGEVLFEVLRKEMGLGLKVPGIPEGAGLGNGHSFDAGK